MYSVKLTVLYSVKLTVLYSVKLKHTSMSVAHKTSKIEYILKYFE